MAPFRRGTLRPARPPAVRAPPDSRPPRSGGLRRRYDGPLAAATASRRPTDRHRPPPLLQSPGPVGALEGTNGRGQRRLGSPSGPGPSRFPGRCRRRDLGGRCLGAAPFWRPDAHRSWLWQRPSLRAWARQLSALPRATGTAGSSDRDRRTLRPRPQSARSGVVGQLEIMGACRSSRRQGPHRAGGRGTFQVVDHPSNRCVRRHPAESSGLSEWIREVVPVPHRPCVPSGGARSRIGSSAGWVWRGWPRCNGCPNDDQYHERDRSSRRAEPPRRRTRRRRRISGPGDGDAGSGRPRHVGEK